MSDSIERALQRALPDQTVETISPQTTRPGNETAFVTFADSDPVYVKTVTGSPRRLRREIAAVRYAGAHCPVGTPAVVAADSAGDPPYLVTEPLPGTLFNDRWTGDGDREQSLHRLGAVVADVNRATFDSPGVVTGGDADGLELHSGTWTETLCRTIEARADDWFPQRFADLPERLVETVRAVDPVLEGPPTLVHGDPSRINLHLDPTGLLDWERALVGDPAFGLVDAMFHHTGQPDVSEAEQQSFDDALLSGYRDQAGGLPPGFERYEPLYRAVSYLLVPQAFDDWSDDAEAPADELAADVRSEFDTRLAAARETATADPSGS
ncbi:phosphotransferase family protein [Haloarcula pelagica]|uniref:phosphotransferase family protein n=1 Tax=Haloarcula pelagica TaxID=3033389 RepID=UPI0024C294FA|nr:aminoglycoside phosphotransferase family protein [Halomicroarcula sp. YJ-61-S]